MKKKQQNMDKMVTCDKCGGSGKIGTEVCKKCNGTGKVRILEDKTTEFK